MRSKMALLAVWSAFILCMIISSTAYPKAPCKAIAAPINANLQSGFPCPNALENRACVLRRLAAFLGRFVSYPYKVSRPYIQAARRPSERVWRGFMIHYSDLTKPALRAYLSTRSENRPLFGSFSADFQIIFGFCY